MDISQITSYLYIAANVKGGQIETIRELGVGLVISMIAHKRPPEILSSASIDTLWLRTFDFFLLPIPVEKLARGVEVSLPIINSGHSVITYCQAGRHRSVAMASCILISMGYSADEAMELISQQRKVADPYAGHIQRQIRKFERYWKNDVTSTGDLADRK